jgi:hypothetical protein
LSYSSQSRTEFLNEHLRSKACRESNIVHSKLISDRNDYFDQFLVVFPAQVRWTCGIMKTFGPVGAVAFIAFMALGVAPTAFIKVGKVHLSDGMNIVAANIDLSSFGG